MNQETEVDVEVNDIDFAQTVLGDMLSRLGASWMEITINNDGRLWLTWDRDDQWVYDEGDLSAAFDTAVNQVKAEK